MPSLFSCVHVSDPSVYPIQSERAVIHVLHQQIQATCRSHIRACETDYDVLLLLKPAVKHRYLFCCHALMHVPLGLG